jgi:hypothetical protein
VWHIEPDRAAAPALEAAPARIMLDDRRLDVRALSHDGRVTLPSGNALPVSGVAFGSIYHRSDRSAAPFFVLALPEVWPQNPKAASDARLDQMILGVFSHEVVHTRQLVHASNRVDELKKRFTVPDPLDDDVVEKRFRSTAGFAAAYEEETALLYRAAVTADPSERRTLAREALTLVDARHGKYYSGPDAVFAELEGLFLNMEGVAVWIAFRLSQVDPRFDIGIRDPAADRARNSWSQDEGLAVMLLVDALVPDWRERMLGAEMASPWVLFAAGPGASAAGGAGRSAYSALQLANQR